MASKTKMDKDYLRYNSHPLNSDEDGLADGDDDNKREEWYVTDRDSLLFMELAYRDEMIILKEFF